MAARVFTLSAHASYACRHSGACCTAGWPIPVEVHARPLLGTPWLVPGADGCCPQYDRDAARCRVHRDHGEAMLPRSCHHFPRRALIDSRGAFVTLSHFCPTAAALLVDHDGPLAIVGDAPAFPVEREYEGLDARGEWPPLLRPSVLFDPQSYSLWERHMVETLSSGLESSDALARLADDAERLRGWDVTRGPLATWTRTILGELPSARPFTGSDTQSTRSRYAPYTGAAVHGYVHSLVPRDLRPSPSLPEALQPVDQWERMSAVAGRYLAAKAFASWTAYQARGIRAQIAELHVAASVLAVESSLASRRLARPLDREVLIEAVRAADLLLMHLVDRERFIDWLAHAEQDDAVRRRA